MFTWFVEKRLFFLNFSKWEGGPVLWVYDWLAQVTADFCNMK